MGTQEVLIIYNMKICCDVQVLCLPVQVQELTTSCVLCHMCYF